MKIIVFAPHNDDEVLGCGGMIAGMAEKGNDVYICEVTSSKNSERMNVIKEEALKAHKLLNVKETIFLDLPVVALKEMSTAEKNKAFLDAVEYADPDAAFIPFKGDLHIDHREVSEAALVALRPRIDKKNIAVYAYETLSETEWNMPTAGNCFQPNAWYDITETLGIKLQAMKCYKTQLKEFPHPRSLEAIEALAKLRGSSVCCRAAEAFFTVRSFL